MDLKPSSVILDDYRILIHIRGMKWTLIAGHWSFSWRRCSIKLNSVRTVKLLAHWFTWGSLDYLGWAFHTPIDSLALPAQFPHPKVNSLLLGGLYVLMWTVQRYDAILPCSCSLGRDMRRQKINDSKLWRPQRYGRLMDCNHIAGS